MKRRIFLSAVIVAMIMATGFSYGQSTIKETGEKAVLDDIVTEVSGGKLVIKKENWRLNMNEKVTVYITMPELNGLGVSGSGRVRSK